MSPSRCRAAAVEAGGGRGAPVEFRDHAGEPRHERRAELAANRKTVENLVLVEAPHLEDRVHQRCAVLVGVTEAQTPIFAQDTPHFAVDVGCGPPVHLEFAPAQ